MYMKPKCVVYSLDEIQEILKESATCVCATGKSTHTKFKDDENN